MGCCCLKIPPLRKKPAINAKKVTILVLGLDNSGKSTVVKRLGKESVDDVIPTVGFAACELQRKGCNIFLYDVGGGPKIRDIWKQYYADVHGIIFVVDSHDVERMEECRKVLRSVLKHSKISGKPILLLANKQDFETSLDEIDIVEKLQLECLVNEQRCPTLVELCAAKISPHKIDTGIDNGFKWLLRNITKDYPSLNNRVLVDMASQDEAENLAMDNRKKRLEKVRLDRSKDGDIHDNDEDDLDPFKPISQLVVKPTQNGGVHTSRHPSMTPDDDDDDNDVAIGHNRSTQSQLFFSSQDWRSTSQLLEGLHLKSQVELRDRPKSSGALEFKVKKKKKKKRRLRVKNNKTSPIPLVDFSNPQVNKIPAIFDPVYHTDVTVLANKDGQQQNGGTSLQQSGEVILNISSLSSTN